VAVDGALHLRSSDLDLEPALTLASSHLKNH
jgi:hypothetical protein